jgi:hypothetical protein
MFPFWRKNENNPDIRFPECVTDLPENDEISAITPDRQQQKGIYA